MCTYIGYNMTPHNVPIRPLQQIQYPINIWAYGGIFHWVLGGGGGGGEMFWNIECPTTMYYDCVKYDHMHRTYLL